MSHIRVLICRVEDPTSEQMTELAAVDLPTPDLITLAPATALDELETVTLETGNAILRRALQAQWDLIDAALVAQYRQQGCRQPVMADGHAPVTVASRFGTLTLSRQVCQQGDPPTHVLPGTAVLPPHHGMIMTRGLQEGACLLPQELPFVSVARLLGWQTHEAQILGETILRSLLRRHGQLLRQAEQAEVVALAAQDHCAPLDLQRVPQDQPRRRAGWPKELNAAVDAALANGQIRPPDGVAWADWERVVVARRADACQTVEDLRHLGPQVATDQVLLTIDEVLTRRQEGDRFVELRTARIATAAGYRYISGVGTAFLQQVRLAVLLAVAGVGCRLLIVDGARWIRTFFSDMRNEVTHKAMILDW